MVPEQSVILESLISQRKHTILMLQEFADTADIIYQTRANSEVKANTVGVIGGFLAMGAGGAMILASGGLATPFVTSAVSYASLAAGGTSIGGGVWSIKNGYYCASDVSMLDDRIRNVLQEDEKKIRDMMEEIRHRCRVRDSSVLEPAKVAAEINGVNDGCLDGNENKKIISSIPPVINIIQHGRFPILAGTVELIVQNRVAKDITRIAVGKKFKKVIRKQVATKTTQIACKESTEEGVKAIATQTSTKVATKQVTREVAKKGAETGAKTAVKVAGAVTITFGCITFLWEGYNAYQNYHASYEESELGRELRRLAHRLERSLVTGNITY